MSRIIRFLAAAGLAAAGGATAAPTSTSDDMAEVLVTTKRLEETLPQQLAQFGNRVTTVEREAVRNGGYIDVTQSLQALAPGLYVQPKNGPFDYADISMLGSRTGDVLWLVDGVRINNRLYAGTPPLDTLPSSIISRLEVLEGGQALFYGTDATAGAVNIMTQPFTDAPAGYLNLGTDTNHGIHADGVYSTAFGAHRAVVFASRDKTDGYESFRREDYEASSTHRKREYDALTLGAKYGIDLTDALRFSASYIRNDADLDFAQPYRVASNVNARKEDIATVKMDFSANENFDLYLKGYYHRWHTTYDTLYNSLETPGDKVVIYDGAFWGYDDRGINALARLRFRPGVEYFAGYDLQRYGGRDEVLFIEQHNEVTQAAFAQVRTTPELLPKTHFAAGLRYNKPDFGSDATVWNASGQYDISSSLFVRTTFGTNFRLPTAEELFANDPFYERGNPNLKPERTKSINLSIGGRTGESNGLQWEIVGFAREITDLIDYGEFNEDTGQDVFDNVPGKIKVRGAQLVLNAAVANTLSAGFSFTHNRSHQEDGEQILRVPEQFLKASLDYHPTNSPFGATLAVNYTGNIFTTVDGTRLNYGKYSIVDISGRYFLDPERKHRLSVSLQNAFDEEFGRPQRGCRDVAGEDAFDCSVHYAYTNLGLTRTLRASYSYAF